MPELSLRHVYVPAVIETVVPSPGVTLIHGLGADEYDLLPLTEVFPQNFQYVSVRGPLPHPLGGAQWYEYDERFRPTADTLVDCFDRLQKFIDEAREAYTMEPLYLLGVSMGSAMALASFLHRPNDFAGAVGLIGYLVEGCGVEFNWESIQGKPVFVGHGVNDDVVPIELGREARDKLTAAGADLTYQEYAMGHEVSDATARDVAKWLADRF